MIVDIPGHGPLVVITVFIVWQALEDVIQNRGFHFSLRHLFVHPSIDPPIHRAKTDWALFYD